MLGTAASSRTKQRTACRGQTKTVKSGAVIFLISSSTITSLAICRRLDGSVLQAVTPRLHFPNAALKPRGEGLVGERRPDDGREDLMQVGEALNGIGEGLLVDLGVLRPDPVANGAIGSPGER